MQLDLPPHKLTIADRIFLAKRRVLGAFKLSKNAVAFFCHGKSGNYLLLKFSYAGNTQYHRIERDEADSFLQALEALKFQDTEKENSTKF